MDQARGPVLQRPLQVEDSIQFLHQRIQECNACLPYTGTALECLSSDLPGGMWVCLALPVRLANQITIKELRYLHNAHMTIVDNGPRVSKLGICSFKATLCAKSMFVVW